MRKCLWIWFHEHSLGTKKEKTVNFSFVHTVPVPNDIETTIPFQKYCGIHRSMDISMLIHENYYEFHRIENFPLIFHIQ